MTADVTAASTSAGRIVRQGQAGVWYAEVKTAKR